MSTIPINIHHGLWLTLQDIKGAIMRKQTFQHAEIRDENDNIISAGAYGKNTALSNKQNDGWVDYVMNNLERLYEKGKTDASTMTKELAKKADKGTVENALMGKAEKADVYTKQKVDGKFNECEKKQTLKKIDAAVNTDYVDYFSCYQIGHTVQVNISVNDTTVSGGVIVRNLPNPLDELIFDSPIHGDDGKSIRLKLTLGGLLAFHFTNVYKKSSGKEFQTFFTYLTEDI